MLKDCPRCYRILEEVPFEDLRVDACPGCGGIWFDEGELARLARAGAGALRKLDDRHRDTGVYTRRPTPRCPSCRQPLAPFFSSLAPQLQLDACRECRGIWVDERELAGLADSLERAAAQRKPG